MENAGRKTPLKRGAASGAPTFVDVLFSRLIVERNIKPRVLNEAAPRKYYGNIKAAQTENERRVNRRSQRLGKWRAVFEGWRRGLENASRQEAEQWMLEHRPARKENRITAHVQCTQRMSRYSLLIIWFSKAHRLRKIKEYLWWSDTDACFAWILFSLACIWR
jgi:hypothetical protein